MPIGLNKTTTLTTDAEVENPYCFKETNAIAFINQDDINKLKRGKIYGGDMGEKRVIGQSM